MNRNRFAKFQIVQSHMHPHKRPIRNEMPNKLASQDALTDTCNQSLWIYLPDHLLLSIFKYLPARKVLDASQVCCQWHRVALDEYLWRDLFYQHFRISRSIPMAPGMLSWRSEFKRLSFHTPCVESEVLHEHRDQVLHVSFAHHGGLFATTSKDGLIKVWNAVYPCTLRYYADMKEYTWKYTQFSQFNSNDTLLLVSGVHFGSHSTSGEIAVFSLEADFPLQCRVLNKPYDIFGAWYDTGYLLSGNLYWRGNFSSTSVLWLNKASQALESEHESVVTSLYQFLNQNASSIRTILVAKCPDPTGKDRCAEEYEYEPEFDAFTVDKCLCHGGCHNVSRTSSSWQMECTGKCDRRYEFPDVKGITGYDHNYRTDETEMEGEIEEMEKEEDERSKELSVSRSTLTNGTIAGAEVEERTSCVAAVSLKTDLSTGSTQLAPDGVSQPQMPLHDAISEEDFCDKYLIFTMGEKTYTPHQIGIKRITAEKAREIIHGLRHRDNNQSNPNVEDDNLQIENFDQVDHSIELHGHIIGMCLSPDHRFLYVNSRTWPKGYEISDPLTPPPISQEIDIHVIDLETLKEVGSLLRSHKAFTPNDECFFIFLDVSSQYIASGAEDMHGYLWDRHYGICLRKFSHNDVVNSVAFNPSDPEVLVSVSDDYSIKIWRSQNREQEVKRKQKVPEL